MSTRVRIAPMAVALALASAPSWGALNPAEQTCQKKVGGQGRVFFKTVAKALAKCHDGIGKGKLPAMTDCSVEPTAAAKIAKAETKITAKVTAACPNPVVPGLVFGGQCYGSGTAADLSSCLIQTHEDHAFALAATVYATTGPVGTAEQGCQKSAAGEGTKFATKRHKFIASCKDKVGSGKLAPGTDCAATASASISAALTKSLGKIGLKCPDPTVAGLAFGKPCTGAATGAGLAGCVLGTHGDRDEKMIVAEYGSGANGGTAAAQLIASTTDCVKGPLSRCRVGDYLLKNDKIRVVVQSIQRNLFGIGQYGGQIIDADLVRAPLDPDRDNFEEWSTSINIENTAHYTAISIENDGSDGQAAIIRVTGVDDLLDFLNPSTVVASFGFPFPPAANDTDLPVEVQTDYILEPGKNYVRVETTVQNTGPTTFSIFFGEFLNGSGEVQIFQPAYGFGAPLVTTRCAATASNPCNALVYAGVKAASGVSYGYMNDVPQSSSFTTAGVSVPIIGTEVVLALIGAATPPWTLQPNGNPGDSVSFTRHFIVGDGSVSSVMDTRAAIECRATGTLEGTVTVGGAPVAGTQVTVLGNAAEGPGLAALAKNVITQALTDGAGHYELTVPPGSYNVVANADGHPFEGGGASPLQHPVTIAAYATTTQNMAIPATGALTVTLIDEASAALAGKVSIVGFDPSPDPRNTQSIFGLINNNTGVFGDFGSDSSPFGVTQTRFFDQGGSSGSIALEPGSYQVVTSHGPEYSIHTANVTITSGMTTPVAAQIARVVDSSGYVSGDFHVHSIDSPDSEVDRRERVVTMLAEGVDFFTPSDHDIRTDFQPEVAALGASALISTVTSGEITTFDYGHFNAWPMTIDTSKVNGGSVDHAGAAPDGQDFPSFGNYSLTPGQIIAAAAADPGTNTVQINHIHSHFGIDGNSGLAIDTGVVPPQSPSSAIIGPARRLNPGIANYFDSGFNALEVWIGDDRSQVYTNFLGQNAGDWFNLINQGIVRTGIADSDTHVKVITQAGVPRTMVASPTDAPGALAAIADTLSGNVNAGRTFGTNAPIVRVTSHAVSTGEDGGLELGQPLLISTTDGSVEIDVDVQSPIWAEFDTVEYYVNSTTTRTSSMKETGNGMVSVKRYAITPDYTQTVTPTVVTVNGSIPGAQRLEASTSLTLSGLVDDIWVVVMVKGKDGVSKPLFPVIPNSLKQSTNLTLANLTDGNLGEDGMTALAFTNPLFVDVDGGGWTAPGLQVTP